MSDSERSPSSNLDGESRYVYCTNIYATNMPSPGHSPATAVLITAPDDDEDTEEGSTDEDDNESAPETSSVHESADDTTDTRANVSYANGDALAAGKLDSSDLPTSNVPTIKPGVVESASEDDEGSSAASSDDSSDSDEDEDDSDNDEDEEPALKYEKLGGAAQELFTKDSASALTVSLRLMVRQTYLLPDTL